MEDNLPKEGWFVRNNGRKKFRDVFDSYIPFKGWNKYNAGACYGVDSNGKAFYEHSIEYAQLRHSLTKEITIDEFLEMSEPVEKKIPSLESFNAGINMMKALRNKYYPESEAADVISKSITHNNELIVPRDLFPEFTRKQVCELLDGLHARVIEEDRGGTYTVNYGNAVLEQFKIEKNLIKEDNAIVGGDNFTIKSAKQPSPYEGLQSLIDEHSEMYDYFTKHCKE